MYTGKQNNIRIFKYPECYIISGERERERKTERQRDRETERDTEREREKERDLDRRLGKIETG